MSASVMALRALSTCSDSCRGAIFFLGSFRKWLGVSWINRRQFCNLLAKSLEPMNGSEQQASPGDFTNLWASMGQLIPAKGMATSGYESQVGSWKRLHHSPQICTQESTKLIKTFNQHISAPIYFEMLRHILLPYFHCLHCGAAAATKPQQQATHDGSGDAEDHLQRGRTLCHCYIKHV